jgi:iron complex outermembrane receptor protein
MIGGEASGQVPLPVGLSLRASLAYSVGQNLSADSPLPEIPPLQGTVGLKYAWGASFFAEANERWAARQNRVDPSLGESATAAWYVTDLRMGASYQGLQLVLELRNLLDRQYVEHLSYLRDPFASGLRVPEPGRTLLATLRYAL